MICDSFCFYFFVNAFSHFSPQIAPRINGPRVFGCRPGHPLLFSIPASGAGALTYSIESLPDGLILDAKTGIITGILSVPGVYPMTIQVEGMGGMATRDFTIHCGSRLSLTPPMGWNSWNCWGPRVSQENVLASARMLASKLRAHGWAYVNIDDGWQGERSLAAPHALQPNEKFPNMAELGREIHSLGLKFGIYSSPWVTTYCHFRGGSDSTPSGQSVIPPSPKDWWERRAGFYQGLHSFAMADAQQWAAWGVDYLKYDWYPNDLTATREMNLALQSCGRDIVLSLSNCLALGSVNDMVSQAQLWRTTGDIHDSWYDHTKEPMKNQGIRDIIAYHQPFESFQKPGAWNDPDMLVLGLLGWGKELKPSRLTREEQTTHFALWCLWSAPLLIGCPLDQLDDFTLSLLTNDELIDVNQDARGVQAYTIRSDGDILIVRKPLADGTCAYGLLNLGEESQEITLDWKLAELPDAPHLVRDLIQRKDLGEFRNECSTIVPPHGIAAWLCSLA